MRQLKRSGSTYGQALSLIKETARSLIDMLGQNDYVAVVKVRL